MKITKQSRREGKLLFRSCLQDGVLDENKVRSAFQMVISRKPRGYVAILSHLQRLVRLDVERRTARVQSASALSPAQESEVRNDLSRRYGAGLAVSFSQDPALIGGLRIQVGSDVYDGSVQARLAALRESF